MLFVIDSEKKLIGSLSDGDIRRGILNGAQLDEPILALMNAHPFFISTHEQGSVDLRFF
ncbi:hypothetical protein [Algoriphagus boritolerans]|uniref:hypothetical protein n=1 Tax=Algoriphagus boritolerans TaxID=308111 RepID=UPI002FCE6751